MKSKKSQKRNKTKKGGFTNFFNSNKPSVVPSYCDPNQLSLIKGSNALHNNYQKCCPKTYLGSKNSSPYCKQVDLNFQAALKNENNANDYQEVNQDFSQDNGYNGYNNGSNGYNNISQNNSAPIPYLPPNMINAQKKPWYKFWGGKTKKNRKNKKKNTRKNKK
jgi:hypothetical protein